MRHSLALVTLGVGLVAAACGNDSGSQGGDDTGPAPRATWYQDVAPIFAEHCMSCHQAGGIAPFSLTDYEDAVEVSQVEPRGVLRRLREVDVERGCEGRFLDRHLGRGAGGEGEGEQQKAPLKWLR